MDEIQFELNHPDPVFLSEAQVFSRLSPHNQYQAFPQPAYDSGFLEQKLYFWIYHLVQIWIYPDNYFYWFTYFF
jgi:hypothetical protein